MSKSPQVFNFALFKFFKRYPERSLVKLHPDNRVNVYINGKWSLARVIDNDCSLTKIEIKSNFFALLKAKKNNATTASKPAVAAAAAAAAASTSSFSLWLFRGSFCLYPLYEQILQKIKNSNEMGMPLNDYEIYVKEKREDNIIEFDNNSLSVFASSMFPCNPPRNANLNSKWLPITLDDCFVPLT